MTKFAIAREVRKATRADARYLPNDTMSAAGWTPEMDRQLFDLCQEMHMTAASRAMGINIERVQRRVHRLGIPCISVREAKMPTKGEWIAAATRAALAAGINPTHVMRGSCQRSHVRARWAAWKAILDQNPNYSIKGLSVVSGFDHSTLLHGMKRLKQLSEQKEMPSYAKACERSAASGNP